MLKKRYYSKVKGTRFVMPDGSSLNFVHGFYDTSDPAEQKELDAILGTNPLIYIQEKLPEPLPKVVQNAKTEAEIMAGEAALRALGGKVITRQEAEPVIPENLGKLPDPNTSTIDPAIQNEFAAARAEAAARAAARIEGSAPSVS